jgi:hypothetical protein
VDIIIRGDAGFCRDDIMAWCEANDVQLVLGLAKNKPLLKQIEEAMSEAERLYQEHGQASRVFDDWRYRTVDSWSQARRVDAKAEHLAKGVKPRGVVTSLPAARADARTLYEDIYCACGDMENRIQEQPLDLFADRTRSHTMRANQNRLYCSSFAYVLLWTVRRLGLPGTELARAQCGTIRLKLLKSGAQVRVSVRRVRVSCSESFPGVALYRQAVRHLCGAPPGVIAT